MRIALVGSKGGVGKTTTALYFAVAATDAGCGVVLVDADPQGSLAGWVGELDSPPFDVVTVTGAEGLASTIESQRADVVIVDTGPHDMKTIAEALACCHIGVSPVAPSPVEIEQTAEVAALARAAGTDLAMLVTRARARTRSLSELVAGLDRHEVLRFDRVIPLREAVAGAYGTIPTKLYGYDDVWRELHGFLETGTRAGA
ncbi:MAG: ParA family protein [Acidimicrobiia bacterium]|nr:ParA family protein [Acidimicrobiia bacterium]